MGALTQANIASTVTADSYLKVSHVTRTRHAHQVTASSLNILLHKAYTEYSSSQRNEKSLSSLEAWCEETAKTVHSLVHHSATGTSGDDICEITEGG